MTVKQLLVADLSYTLEETANAMADRMILETLAKNGKLSIEEAEFFNTLVHRVITEAAEDFVPDQVMTPTQGGKSGDVILLTGQDGTHYQYNQATGELTPVSDMGNESYEDTPEEDDMGDGSSYSEESTRVRDKATELTESQMIVSNLIKSLGA